VTVFIIGINTGVWPIHIGANFSTISAAWQMVFI